MSAGLAHAASAARPSLGMVEFVQQIVSAAERFGPNELERMHAAMAEPIRRLVERDDLLELGLPRPGNNVAESYYLYFDGEVSVVLFQVPGDRAVQPHDHGLWETLFVYRGALLHTVYERTDDGHVPGRAVLREHATATLHPGEGVVVAPPRDIHGFRALSDGTYGITVSRGIYNSERLYFDVEAQTCATRRPRTLR